MKLVVLISSQMERGLDIAQAWSEAGAPGVTMLRSMGIQSLRNELHRGEIELPSLTLSMGAALAAIAEAMEQTGIMILAVVKDGMVDTLQKITTGGIDLDGPDNGVFFVIDLERAIGVRDLRSVEGI